MGDTEHCQCDPRCKLKLSRKDSFCKKHTRSCPRKSPLTGWEPKYEPKKWSFNPKIRKTHNCFSYAMNVQDIRQVKACGEEPNCNVSYHQPGAAAQFPGFSEGKLKSCPEMTARIRGENPTIYTINFTSQCGKGTSKIAVVVDPDEDYHFYRQDSNGYWSHKPGSLKVTNKDASGRLIYDPALANRNYKKQGSDLDYSSFCSYYCVPRNQSLYMKVGGGATSLCAASSSPPTRSGYSSTRRSRDHTRQEPRRNRTVRKGRDSSSS